MTLTGANLVRVGKQQRLTYPDSTLDPTFPIIQRDCMFKQHGSQA